MAKINMSDLSIVELNAYEEAANKICLRYENSLRVYNGSIRTDTCDYNEYEKFNKIHLRLLKEMENRLGEL